MATFKITLGATVTDSVTGFCGMVVGRAEYTTGCKQYCVSPRVKEDGDLIESRWFDEDRLALSAGKRKARKPIGGPRQNAAPHK